jgi:hypothetical protein
MLKALPIDFATGGMTDVVVEPSIMSFFQYSTLVAFLPSIHSWEQIEGDKARGRERERERERETEREKERESKFWGKQEDESQAVRFQGAEMGHGNTAVKHRPHHSAMPKAWMSCKAKGNMTTGRWVKNLDVATRESREDGCGRAACLVWRG